MHNGNKEDMGIGVNVEIIAFEGDKITDRVTGHNLIVNQGLNNMGRLLIGQRKIQDISFGTGANAAQITDTALQAFVGAYSIVQSDITGNTLTMIAFVPVIDLPNVSIREVGLRDSTGMLLARFVLPAAILKTNQKGIQATWSIVFNRG